MYHFNVKCSLVRFTNLLSINLRKTYTPGNINLDGLCTQNHESDFSMNQ